jgi:hypothetical protein
MDEIQKIFFENQNTKRKQSFVAFFAIKEKKREIHDKVGNKYKSKAIFLSRLREKKRF